MTEIRVDLFAGAGGASTGIEAAIGCPVDLAINHDPIALAVHRANHPETEHLEADVWEVRPEAACRGRPVGLLWASPDCTHFSRAKGGTPRKQHIRSLANVVVTWARAVAPRVILLENVAEFTTWGPLDEAGEPIRARMGEDFARWRRHLEQLGYVVDYRILDASRYGAPTRRRRLFLVARRDGLPIRWPAPTHGPNGIPYHTAAECIDWSLVCPSIFERRRPLADKTLWRIAQGIRRFVLDTPQPFIVKVNHGRPDARIESLAEPLTTVTAQRRGHALVAPTMIQAGYGERDGQAARVLDLQGPLGTVVAGGVKHALAAAALVKFRGQCHGAPVDGPMPTVTAGGLHVAEVRAFLTAYYGSDATSGQAADAPLRAVTSRDRLGLVMVHGEAYEIADIGMRMLQPHELLRAQFGRFAAAYDLTPAATKTAKTRLIGNSVCPEVAEALVRANYAPMVEEVAA